MLQINEETIYEATENIPTTVAPTKYQIEQSSVAPRLGKTQNWRVHNLKKLQY